MNFNNVDFVTYCIGNLSRRLGLSAGERCIAGSRNLES